MFGLEGIRMYFAIFIGELIYLVLDTLYVISLGDGKRFTAAGLGLIKMILWICVTGSIITNIVSDPLKIIVYCCAHALGLFLGMTIEKKRATGLVSLYVLSAGADERRIAQELHKNQFGVTMLGGHSVDGTKREIIMVHLRRCRVPEAVRLVRRTSPHAFISTYRLTSVLGGYVR